MARKPKQEDLKVGQRIRVRRNDYHNAKFGALGTITYVSKSNDDVVVTIPCRFWSHGGAPREYVEEQYIELEDILHVVKDK